MEFNIAFSSFDRYVDLAETQGLHRYLPVQQSINRRAKQNSSTFQYKAAMNLSSFIIGNMEEILVEWEAFAKQVQPESGDMSSVELRDHGKQILEEISREVDCEETDKEKCDKSKGIKPDANHDSAASEHGTVRHASGFTMPQVISEYRAMRASVLKLWMPKMTSASEQTWNEIFRFNEAIDKALAESAMT